MTLAALTRVNSGTVGLTASRRGRRVGEKVLQCGCCHGMFLFILSFEIVSRSQSCPQTPFVAKDGLVLLNFLPLEPGVCS